jgi:hypothetical protein
MGTTYTWLRCPTYVCFILNFLVSSALYGGVPIQRATGSTNDISPLLRFRFWEPVYYKLDDSTFPSESHEKLGRFVGIAENAGHFMAFKILTNDNKKILFRSNVRSALDPKAKNLRLDPLSGETSIPVIIKSRHESDSSDNKEYQRTPMPIFHPTNLVGKTYLMDPMEDGQQHRARIVRAIEDHNGEIEDNPTRIKFLCSINNDESEEIVTYNKILNHIENDETEETTICKIQVNHCA